MSIGPIQIVGNHSSPLNIAPSGVAVSGPVDLRDMTELRTLWIEHTGSGTIKVDVIPWLDAAGTVAGTPVELVSGITVDTTVNIPFNLLPYTPFGQFTITETAGANSAGVYAFFMGNGA